MYVYLYMVLIYRNLTYGVCCGRVIHLISCLPELVYSQLYNLSETTYWTNNGIVCLLGEFHFAYWWLS